MVGYSIHQNKIRNDFDVINNLLIKWLCGRFQAIGHSVRQLTHGLTYLHKPL